MSAFWVKFKNGKSAMCVEGKTEAAARTRAEAIGEIKSIKRLPYPATPRMEPYEEYEVPKWDPETKRYGTEKEKTVCPAFCYTPNQCEGRTCCPKDYACSE